MPLALTLLVTMPGCHRKVKPEIEFDPSVPPNCWAQAPAKLSKRVIVDFSLGRRYFEERELPPEKAASIEGMGGRILHRFNVPVLRVEMDTTSLRAARHEIGGTGPLYAVEDTTNLHLPVDVFFDRTVSTEDVERMKAAGALSPRIALGTMITATAHDSVIPKIRAVAHVLWIRALTGQCHSSMTRKL